MMYGSAEQMEFCVCSYKDIILYFKCDTSSYKVNNFHGISQVTETQKRTPVTCSTVQMTHKKNDSATCEKVF